METIEKEVGKIKSSINTKTYCSKYKVEKEKELVPGG